MIAGSPAKVHDSNRRNYFIIRRMSAGPIATRIWAMAAAKMAMQDTGVDLEKINRIASAQSSSSGIGGLKRSKTSTALSSTRARPAFPLSRFRCSSATWPAAYLDGVWLCGPEFCIVTACATSNTQSESWRHHQVAMPTSFPPAALKLRSSRSALRVFLDEGTQHANDEPKRASRPFDRDRDGFVMGEGARVVVVESSNMRKPARENLCELTGYGLSADAHHMTAPPPDGEGAVRAMANGARSRKTTPEQVDYINAHATSTGLGDICETRAIKTVFGDYAKTVSISATNR